MIKSIKTTRKLPDGIYIRGSVQGYPLLFTADTGASRTIISKKVFEAMKQEDKPELKRSAKLVGPSGTVIKELGKGSFNVKLGAVELEIEAIVADIEDDGLLGVDILQNGNNGPADLMMSKGVLYIEGKEVPIIQIGMHTRTRRVTSADHFVIPPQSEAIIDVYVERQEYDDFSSENDYLIEPTEHFEENYPLKMAASLVDISKGCTCKVRMLNPFPTEMSIKQDAVVGQAVPIEGKPIILAEEENVSEVSNLQSIRRIDCQRQAEVPVRAPINKTRIEMTEGKTILPEHLAELHKRATVNLSPGESQKVAELLSRYEDCFSKDEWDLGLCPLIEHEIKTGDAEPVKQPPRRVPLAYADKEKAAIEDLKSKGVIRESVSPWASPIVLVSKKDGSVRPCVDYRKVNQLVKPDGFPLPRVQDCLDAVAGSSYFSTFDLTSGYFQIKLKEEDIPKSAFVCKYGHFEMTRMPFGLNSAASTFQRTMEMALQGLQWLTCLIYIDDIIVFGKDFDEHIARVEQVLERLRLAGLKLKPTKCEMLQTEVSFLGHVVSGVGVKPSPTNVSKILGWPKPKNAKQVKQFVAMGSYYRRYIKDFAAMVRPMVDLTKKGKKFVWSESCDQAFEKLKQALTSADVMGYPLNEGGMFVLDVDASDVGIGGVLHQIQGDRERVIAYASRALNKAESNYCITEKELLAVRYFVEYFRQYLLGRRFLVRSDHQSLVWLFRLKEPRGKIARWIEILSQYDFSIEYRAGNKQGHCDALSRCDNPRDCECSSQDMNEPLKCGPCRKCVKRAQDMFHKDLFPAAVQEESADHSEESEKLESTDKVVREAKEAEPQPGPSSQSDGSPRLTRQNVLYTPWANGWTTAELQTLQLEDPDIGPILQAKLTGEKPCNKEMVCKSPACRHYWILWDLMTVHQGLLFKKFLKKDGTGEYQQFVVPRVLKKDILFQMHDSVISGHLGCKKTKEKTLQRFYWYSLKDDIALYIQKCDTCESNKKPMVVPRAPLGSLRSGAPGDFLATDFLGPLPVTARGNRYILLVTDHFTKYVEIIPVPDMTAEVCASKILNEVISRWGCPLTIHSDQGRTYESQVFSELCRMLEVKKSRTSPRNPKGNGQSERFNRTLLRMIKAYLRGEQKDWDLYLGCLAGAYRATPNESTKLTPNLLMMGREVRLPAELVFGSLGTYHDQEVTSYGDFVDSLRERMQHAHDVARKHLDSAAKRSREIYDNRVLQNKYSVGDAVWSLLEARKLGINPKLEPTYEGPFLVKKNYANVDLLLQMDGSGKERLTHHDKLKPYRGDYPPRWLVKAKKRLMTPQ